ncbi:MAG: co-chaperone GroES family protein [Planctomycetota bacterium]|jgi:chaperonin GroES|nr:co-chaperone GroES family protein [Planctomycetota bacterium]MDA1223464.1 co-chaperone GroES family protein [Planctomycetota bacterium]
MKIGNKELLVVGDRVLVEPDRGETRTKIGLYLPPGVKEKEEVRGGRVVAMGPGIALPPLQDDTEPWKAPATAGRFLPMQVEVGDFVLFFRKAAFEVTFEERQFLVVPHGAILIVVRGADVPDALPDEI